LPGRARSGGLSRGPVVQPRSGGARRERAGPIVRTDGCAWPLKDSARSASRNLLRLFARRLREALGPPGEPNPSPVRRWGAEGRGGPGPLRRPFRPRSRGRGAGGPNVADGRLRVAIEGFGSRRELKPPSAFRSKAP